MYPILILREEIVCFIILVFLAFISRAYRMGRDGRIFGAEALVRWQKPDGSMMMPGDFIETLEGAGLIQKLDVFMSFGFPIRIRTVLKFTQLPKFLNAECFLSL